MLLAIFLPPVACLLKGKPIKALIALCLWPLAWVPASIYALVVVSDAKADKRVNKIVNAVKK
jgi:uncharacterized membrane protein YqaE (UPF0057 family)